MPRWQPDGFERLQAAAFELFADQGFERTTVAEIAQRAGLTQRTFFNHFADKREVLFGLSSEFQQEIVREIAACADAVPPLDAVVRALQAAADTIFEERRAAVTRRLKIIAANPELQEREFSKGAALTDAIAAALHARGLDPETALLTAGAGMLVQQAAIQRWTQPAESRPLPELLSDALHALRTTVNEKSGRDVARSRT
jgi:AcrR family transcriptional regulator